jgi:organic radical activating enzyme
MLEINEIFGPTIQGEGKLVGTPSIFIRVGKCNLRCEGFNVEYETPSGVKKCSCDTYYAVDMVFKDQWQSMCSKDIIKKVSKILPNYKIDLVITGGEPLLYWRDIEFQELLKYYIEAGNNLTIETNASLNIDITKKYQEKIIFSMSVKLSNSLEPLRKRLNIDTITKILKNTSHSYLKFVVNKEFKIKADTEIKNILKQIPKADVYLMPMGDTAKQINQNCKSIIDMAIDNGYKYCDRLHIRVWDNKRGV